MFHVNLNLGDGCVEWSAVSNALMKLFQVRHLGMMGLNQYELPSNLVGQDELEEELFLQTVLMSQSLLCEVQWFLPF